MQQSLRNTINLGILNAAGIPRREEEGIQDIGARKTISLKQYCAEH